MAQRSPQRSRENHSAEKRPLQPLRQAAASLLRPFAPETPASESPATEPSVTLQAAQQLGHSLAQLQPTQSPSLWVQPKLTIGAPGDRYEQEADRVAQQVVQQIHAPRPNPQHSDLQRNPEADSIQRLGGDKDLQMRIQRRSPLGAMATTDELEGSISQARGGGQALDSSLRPALEQSFGANFGGVRVHTDTRADQLNQSIQARAFTTGQDVFFRQGEYQPSSRSGQELIAHELTHVVQQTGPQIQASDWLQPQLVSPQGPGEAVIQRTVNTAAEDLFSKGIIEVKKSLLTAKFLKAHGVEKTDLGAIQLALTQLRSGAAPSRTVVTVDMTQQVNWPTSGGMAEGDGKTIAGVLGWTQDTTDWSCEDRAHTPKGKVYTDGSSYYGADNTGHVGWGFKIWTKKKKGVLNYAGNYCWDGTAWVENKRGT